MLMTARGFFRYRGAWRTSQEIELIERSERATVSQKQWGPRLEKLRRRLDDPATSATATEELREIVDPAAVPSLGGAVAQVLRDHAVLARYRYRYRGPSYKGELGLADQLSKELVRRIRRSNRASAPRLAHNRRLE
jgi:hypothetical protein